MAIDAGMPAGLSSVVMQSQAVFTVAFAAALLKERPVRLQLAALAVAVAGVVVVAARLGPDRPPLAFALVLGAAGCWALGNIVVRKAAPADMLNFMVWLSAAATPVLVALTLALDGPNTGLAAIRSMTWSSLGALVYISGLSTLAGWGLWGALIRRHGASTVAPFSMLVPFFGIASAAVVLHEPVHATDVVGGLLVVGGVLAGALAPRRATDRSERPGAERGTDRSGIEVGGPVR
jgi:O-acetylserine/cysteine efflux transporter